LGRLKLYDAHVILGIVGGAAAFLGIVLIVVGTVISIIDWNAKRRRATKPGEFETDALGAAEVIGGLAKVFDALRDYSTGRFLIAIGVVLIVVGAAVSTIGALT
jgi:uncharacterized membrane protein